MRGSQRLVALRSARGEVVRRRRVGMEGKKKGKTVLIAHGQRNPITVGIDYKIVCVNDFHEESGWLSLEQKKKKKKGVQAKSEIRE